MPAAIPAVLDVRMEGAPVGVMTEQSSGAVLFEYDKSYSSTPLSVSLPLGGRVSDAAHWIDGALPDNDRVRREWARQHGAASAKPVDLLGTPVGWECAGAVQFLGRISRKVPYDGMFPVTGQDIAEWARAAAAGPWPDLAGHGTFSLPGAQPKHALFWDGTKWHRPVGKHPTNRILKIGVVGKKYPDADVVEHICMTTARRMGLRTAVTELVHAGGTRLLSVHRFDRAVEGGALTRVHSEDLCQALRLPPLQKFEEHGGPGLRQIARLLRQVSSRPEQDVRSLLDFVMLNWAMAGTDAHAKNYSLLLRGQDVRLAPAYDIISVYGWEDGTDPSSDGCLSLAMRAGPQGQLLVDSDSAHAWRYAANAVGLPPDEVLSRVRWMLQRIPSEIEAVVSQLPSSIRSLQAVRRLAAGVASRCHRAESAVLRTA